jgi:hypothetical protein
LNFLFGLIQSFFLFNFIKEKINNHATIGFRK